MCPCLHTTTGEEAVQTIGTSGARQKTNKKRKERTATAFVTDDDGEDPTVADGGG